MLERIYPGDKRIPAKTFNAMADAIESVNLGGGGLPDAMRVMVWNCTGQDLPFGSAVGITAPMFDVPQTESTGDPAVESERFRHFADRNYAAVLPKESSTLGVTLSPIADGEVGAVAISGVVRAVVDVKDTAHETVKAKSDTTELESSKEGKISFLIPPTKTGKQWCDLVFGVGGGGGGDAIRTDTLATTLIAASPAYTNANYKVESPTIFSGRAVAAGTTIIHNGRYVLDFSHYSDQMPLIAPIARVDGASTFVEAPQWASAVQVQLQSAVARLNALPNWVNHGQSFPLKIIGDDAVFTDSEPPAYRHFRFNPVTAGIFLPGPFITTLSYKTKKWIEVEPDSSATIDNPYNVTIQAASAFTNHFSNGWNSNEYVMQYIWYTATTPGNMTLTVPSHGLVQVPVTANRYLWTRLGVRNQRISANWTYIGTTNHGEYSRTPV